MHRETAVHTLALLALLTLPGLGHAQTADFPDVAYVNTQEVVTNAPGATAAQQEFQEELKEYQAEIRQMQSTLDSLQRAYQQQEGTLTDEARTRRREEIQQKQQELQQRAQELEEQVGSRQQELLAPILERVQAVIEQLREERGYALVFDVSGPGVVAADPSLDITQDVLDRLEQDTATTGEPVSPAGGSGR